MRMFAISLGLWIVRSCMDWSRVQCRRALCGPFLAAGPLAHSAAPDSQFVRHRSTKNSSEEKNNEASITT
jgi:hypothetical protein